MRWIPVTERLPNESGSYLVTVPMDNGDSYVDALDYHKGKFYEYDSEWGDIEYDDVLAWMPLPEPYKADRKTENSSEIPNGSEKPNNCECEPRKEQNFCGKCRYLYRDFKYGLSCYRLMDNEPCKYEERKTEPTISKMEQVDKDINVRSKEPQTDPCDGCACDDGKHLMYCMNCKGIAWKTEPPKVEDVPKAGMSDMSEIDKMIKMVDGILGDDDLCEGCEYVIEGLSCDECRRKYADKIIKILRSVRKAIKDEPQTERSE